MHLCIFGGITTVLDCLEMILRASGIKVKMHKVSYATN